ncbi:MAG: hypothetical protein U9Q06_01545 [Nanoarchaeota archaeon]|nr:hypothetical protein [Nanoarchaeota archaeon]
MAEVQYMDHIRGLGNVYKVYAPLHDQLSSFKAEGSTHPHLISVRDTAFARLQGKLSDWTRTCHAPVYKKGKKPILIRNSPLMNGRGKFTLAKRAVEAHATGRWLTQKGAYDKYSQQAKEDANKNPEKRRAIVLDEREDFQIDANSPVAQFLFQDTIDKYFENVRNRNPIQVYLINPDTVDNIDESIVNYLWFDSVDNGSGLGARYRDLTNGVRAFGVFGNVPKARAPKNQPQPEAQVKPYNLEDLENAKIELEFLREVMNPEKIGKIETLIQKL